MKKLLSICLLALVNISVNAQEPNDCVNAITVCGNGNFSSNADGIGDTQEVSGCGGMEHNSLWIKINIVQSGTLGFNLIPNNPAIAVDYDFWVYGPNKTCSNLGSPIRCATTNPEMAGMSNNHTGMYGSTTITQTGPGANGNGYVRWLTVTAGQSYYIAIDRPEGDGGFELQWTGSATLNNGAFPIPPLANAIPEIKTCSNTPNIGIFDLNTVRSQINPDLANNTITFHLSLADAIDKINPLPNIIANSSNPQQIFARVEDNVSGCSSITDFYLRVYPVPTASITASSQTVCSGEEVTLTITGTSGASIDYTSNGGAIQQVILDETGTFTITEILTVDTTYQLVEAKIVDANNTVVCSQLLTGATSVSVNEISQPSIATNAPICEGDLAFVTFSGIPDATITYEIDGGNPETVLLDNSGIFVLTIPDLVSTAVISLISITDSNAPFCELDLNITETIVVNPMPTVVDPQPLLACNAGTGSEVAFDLNGQIDFITDGETGSTVTFYLTQELAEEGNPSDALASPHTISANQTVFVRVESQEGCVAYTTLELQLVDGPVANPATPLYFCDPTNQGVGTFDLSQASGQISAGNTQPVVLTFHINQQDAVDNVNAITDFTAFQNTIPYNQIVYVRVSSGAINCYAVTSLELIVNDEPTINPIDPYILCDLDGDGFEFFDLTSLNNSILGNLPQNDFIITFYQTQNDAVLLQNPISNPENYQNVIEGGETIWIRLENLQSGCHDVATLQLQANHPIPLNSSYLATECDNDGDGQTVFNLSNYIAGILANATNPVNYEVVFYPSLQNAIDNINPIDNPNAYSIQTIPIEILGIRVTEIGSGCWNVASLELQVTPLPDATITLLPLELCDIVTPNDASEIFDLTQVENQITNGNSGYNITYHLNNTDAQSGNNSIGNPEAFQSGSTQIYIRVTASNSANTACFAVFNLQLIVNSLPVIVSNSISVCNASNSGFASFNLQQQIQSILGSTQNPADFAVAFFEDSQSLIPITANPYTNTTPDFQIIYVAITNTVTNCAAIYPYELIVEAGATATQPVAVEQCDYEGANDGIASFDLTLLADEILNGQNPNDFSIDFYQSSQDAQNDQNPIANPASYQNTASPYLQTLYIRVKNNSSVNSCHAYTAVDLIVNPLLKPVVFSQNGQNTICVDYQTGILQNQLTLTSNFQGNNYTYAWFLNGTPIPGANQSTYTVNTASPGHYTLAVTETQSTTNCTSELSDSFEIIQSGQAVVVSVSQSSAFVAHQMITVIVEGYGEYWFQLDNGPILDNNGVFYNVPPGLHTVQVYDRKTDNPSCGFITIENIRILDYPKFFTPNGDGYNDTWNISGLRNQPNALIYIFDRYGKVLTSIKPSGAGWNGMYNGNPLPSTDYWFKVIYEESGVTKEFKAHFSMKR